MENTNIRTQTRSALLNDLESLVALDMTVEPYMEVKKYLDKRAHETMYAIRARLNEVLSFTGEKSEN